MFTIEKIVEDAKSAVKAGSSSVEYNLLKEQILQRLNLLSAPERKGMSLKFMELRLSGSISVSELALITNLVRQSQIA